MSRIQKVKKFRIEDIDGAEFVRDKDVGKLIISWDTEEYGVETGLVRVVYSDGSGKPIELEEAQRRLDSGEWTVYRPKGGV